MNGAAVTEFERADARQLARQLLARIERLATDVAWAQAAGVEVSGMTAVVRGLTEQAEHATAALAVAREERQAEQLAGIDLARPLRLHIGAGSTRLPGWINLDVAGADVDVDLRRPLPFAHGSVSHIFCSHVLEHLRHADEAQGFLLECRRVLAPGGKIRVVVPDIAPYLRAHLEADDEFWTTHAKTWTWWDYEHTTSLDRVLHYAGVSTPPTDIFGHRYGYDAETLVSLFSASGFVRVTESSFNGSSDPALRVDDASLVAHATYRGRALSIFVEGTRLV